MKYRTIDRGFTMIEVLVSLAILGFGILALAKFQVTTLFGADRAKQITEAIAVAQSQIEELRSLRYTGINSADPDPVPPLTNTEFTREWTVTPKPGGNSKTVSVEVIWTDQKNDTQTLTLTSNISRGDPVVGGSFMLADDNRHFFTPP